MAKTTKSPIKVAREALRLGAQGLSPYGHKHSPKKYTQAQLFAVLALKYFFRTDYRGIVAILEDSSELRKELGLSVLPHYTTLCHAARRFEQGGGGNLCWQQALSEAETQSSSATQAAVR